VFAPGFVSLTCLIVTKCPSLSFSVCVCVCVCVLFFQLGVSMEVVSGAWHGCLRSCEIRVDVSACENV